MSERRKMERFSLPILARVSVRGKDQDQQAIEVLTKNICAEGALIHNPGFLPVGTQLNIEVFLPIGEVTHTKGAMTLVSVTGSVTRTDKKGMTISFDNNYQIFPLKK